MQRTTMGEEAPVLSTLIDQQARVVSALQRWTAHGENGPDACRQYGTALSAAIDKLATLEGLRDDGAVWRLRREHGAATS
jgi:hypothetical protein